MNTAKVVFLLSVHVSVDYRQKLKMMYEGIVIYPALLREL